MAYLIALLVNCGLLGLCAAVLTLLARQEARRIDRWLQEQDRETFRWMEAHFQEMQRRGR